MMWTACPLGLVLKCLLGSDLKDIIPNIPSAPTGWLGTIYQGALSQFTLFTNISFANIHSVLLGSIPAFASGDCSKLEYKSWWRTISNLIKETYLWLFTIKTTCSAQYSTCDNAWAGGLYGATLLLTLIQPELEDSSEPPNPLNQFSITTIIIDLITM